MSNRKYFGTDGIRGRVGDAPITPEFVLKLGWAAGKVLARHGSRKIIIGKDTRISGYMLESALEAGLAAAGLSASFTGPMPTPAIAYLTRTFRAEAGIVISASHNPFYDNGIKFFSIEGTKLPDEVEEAIEAEMEKELTCVDSAELGKASRIVDAAGRYIEFCKGTFPNELSLNSLKVVVDCAHGATYHIAPSVFRELGAQVIAMGCEPDGLNINEEVGATDVRALQARVLEGAAPVTCRPADLLKPELAALEADVKRQAQEKGITLAENAIDDVLTVALFPQIGLKFLENRNNPAAFEPLPQAEAAQPAAAPAKADKPAASGVYTVEVEGKAFVVKVSDGGDISQLTAAAPAASSAPAQAAAPAGAGTPVTAPLAGTIWKVIAAEGQTVAEGDVLLILEAMKMETEIRAAQAGTVRGIAVKSGDAVAMGDTLLSLA